MMQNYSFLDERAKAAESAAEATALVNVRERELRSAKAWRQMADRQLVFDKERTKSEEARAERIAAERSALLATGEKSSSPIAGDLHHGL